MVARRRSTSPTRTFSTRWIDDVPAKASGPIPPFPDVPFEAQVRLVLDNMKKLLEQAGSNMDCLLKVIVWLKDQRQAEEFDRIYRTYFSSRENLPSTGRCPPSERHSLIRRGESAHGRE